MIDAGTGAIVKGMNEDTLFVSADIPEEFINRVKVGASTEIIMLPIVKTIFAAFLS